MTPLPHVGTIWWTPTAIPLPLVETPWMHPWHLPPSCGNTGDSKSVLHEDVSAESNHAAALHQSMAYANTVNHYKSKNPKDINWISDDIEAKIAPYKLDNMPLSNTKVDPVCCGDCSFGNFCTIIR